MSTTSAMSAFRGVVWSVLVMVACGAIIGGCSQDAESVLPFAKSVPARLVLNVRTGDAAQGKSAAMVPGGVKRRRSRLVTVLPAVTDNLVIEIGERGAPDLIKTDPIDLVAPPGEDEDVTVGNVPPGAAKRVAFTGFDAAGNVTVTGEFRLDFFPGQVTSNDVSVGGAGGGVVTIDPNAPTPTPTPTLVDTGTAGVFFVTEHAMNRVSKIDTNVPGAPPVTVATFGAGASPYGIVREPSTGNLLVTLEGAGQVVRLDLTPGASVPQSVVTSFLSLPRGIAVQANGNLLVVEGGNSDIKRFAPNGSPLGSALSTPFTGSSLFGVSEFNPGANELVFPVNGASEFITREAGGAVSLFQYPVSPALPRSPEFILAQSTASVVISEQSVNSTGALSRLTVNDPNVAASNVLSTLANFGPAIPRGFIAEATDTFAVVQNNPDAIARVTFTGSPATPVVVFMYASPVGVTGITR